MHNKLFWFDDISLIKGVGEKKRNRLDVLGISTIGDLLNHLPFRYKDRRSTILVMNAKEDEQVLLSGKLIKMQSRLLSGNRTITECVFVDSSALFTAGFFNVPYLKKNLTIGKEYSVFGVLRIRNGFRNLYNPEIAELGSEKDIRGLIPVYRCTAGITSNDFIKWIKHAICNNALESDWIDKNLLKEFSICDREFAYNNIHFPQSKINYQKARFRIIYEQLLLYQLAVKLNKKAAMEFSGDSSIDDVDITDFINTLPFKLTAGQKKCLNDIEADLIDKKAMNRLIQGDVGCGKTVIAQLAMYKCVKAGYQAAIMAPTELLARQHYESFQGLFNDQGVKIALLVSGMKASERNAIINNLENGRIDMIIGTHALLQEDVKFHNLALVVTDEQHRFGVNQRKTLVNKGRGINVCVMSATPIPRTLAATVFGDMDFSVIKDKPANRMEIITRSVDSSSRERAYVAAEEEIKKGHQVYVVAPSIDSEDENISSVENLFLELKKKFKDYSIALVHGKMNKQDKEQIMQDFAKGLVDMLIATVVIEVGINVPNASMIIIENSDRFGLAQMHQMRGRVGRSNIQSYCYLVNYSKSDSAIARAKALVNLSDGFEISEEDFRLRGPGDIRGTMQSGSYQNSIISLCNYTDILDIAIKSADYIINNPHGTDMDYVRHYIDAINTTDNSNVI